MTTELPLYQSHKRVRAAKIVKAEVATSVEDSNLAFSLWFDDTKYVVVDLDWVIRRGAIVTDDPDGACKGMVGGWYVVYDDNYSSWSPAKAFEEGYTKVE